MFWEAYNKSQVEDIGKWQVVASDTRGNIAKLEDVLQQLKNHINIQIKRETNP